MKIKKLLLYSFLLISTFLSAQNDNLFGIKIGMNYSQFTPDIEVGGLMVLDYQGKFGYYIGGFYNFTLSERLSLQPELIFSYQGTQLVNGEISLRDNEGNQTVGSINSRINELAILIPLVTRFKLTENFYLDLGPQIGYAFQRNEVIKKNPFDPSTEGQKSNNSPFTTDFDRLDIALITGIGLNLTEKLDLNVRYALGVVERENSYRTSVINFGFELKI